MEAIGGTETRGLGHRVGITALAKYPTITMALLQWAPFSHEVTASYLSFFTAF